MSENIRLKDVYKDLFKIGAALSPVTEKMKNREIGNPEKEKLFLEHFNSLTFENELKPMFNMGFNDESTTEEHLSFVINPIAKTMLDWAKANKVSVRGHVMVWHSQCPKEVFCKGYKPVTIPTDPEELKEKPFLKFFEKLDPVCYVSRETMLKRLESYIFSLVEYMYREGYADTVYAWDVVNEAIELDDRTETGLRNSYWLQVIGDDFIYWSFKYAKTAVDEMAQKYAGQYGVDAKDAVALKAIKPSLFYNDYNEFQPAKQDAIIAALSREGHGHGSVFSEKLIDGIGMQGHVSDTNSIEEYKTALLKYGKLVDEIHLTELDVKATCTNINADYYQAVFYKKLFEALIEAKKEGANVTCVTLWGLTDDTSWIRGANPLLFRGDLSKKLSFDALVYAVTGESLGEPQKVTYDLSDRNYDFSPEDIKSEEDYESYLKQCKLRMLGEGRINITDKVSHSGKYCLENSMRFGAWCGIGVDVSDFIGQTINVSAFVKSPAVSVHIKANNELSTPFTSVKTGDNEWHEIKGTVKIPANVHSMFLFFGTEESVAKTFSPVFADDIKISLVGLRESFEDSENIAAIRGMGHLPVLTVTDKESLNGKSHSLLVTRQEKDATVKFDISSYIGHKISISAYVKTKDSVIRLGIDGSPSKKLTEVASTGDWTKICAETELSSELNSAEFYLETDGNKDMFIDEIEVNPA